MKLQRLKWFTYRWRIKKDEDTRPYFEASLYFQAADMDEAEVLFDAMCDALGCSEDETRADDEPCPHFRFGGLHRIDEDD